MNNVYKYDEEALAWEIIKKHFIDNEGLLGQIKQGRIIPIKLGIEPEECRELRDIQQALEVIGSFAQAVVPKWQVSLLLSIEFSIQDMLQMLPNQGLMLHILHSKLFTWSLNAWYVYQDEFDSFYNIEDDIARRLSDLSLDLRLFEVNTERFSALLQAIQSFIQKYINESSIPRLVAQHFIEVPIMDWSTQWHHHKKKKEWVEEMKCELLALIETCLQ